MDLSTFRAGGGGFVVIFDRQKDRNLFRAKFLLFYISGGVSRRLKQPGHKLYIWKVLENARLLYRALTNILYISTKNFRSTPRKEIKLPRIHLYDFSVIREYETPINVKMTLRDPANVMRT